MGRQEMARHARSWAAHRTVTDPLHDAARKVIAAFRASVVEEDGSEADVEVRDLGVYDRALKVVL